MNFFRTSIIVRVLVFIAFTGSALFFAPGVRAQVCTGVCIDITAGAPPAPGGGGSGSGFFSPSNLSFDVNGGDTCTSSREVAAHVTFSNAVEIAISFDGTFNDAEWLSLDGASDHENIQRGRNQEVVKFAVVPFVLPAGDGPQEVFARFRSVSQNVSGTYADVIFLDQAGLCREIEQPNDGEMIVCEEALRGAYIKSKTYPTVYYVTDECFRRPFITASIFFTHERTFDVVRDIPDKSLAAIPLGYPMLPKPRTILVKLSYSPRVYYVEPSADPNSAVLRWIVSEEVAIANFGPQWDRYTIDLHPTLYPRFTFGSNIVDGELKSHAGELMHHLSLAADKFTYDTDGDGALDYNELEYGSDPENPDTDNDGLNDYYERFYLTDPRNTDTDGDGMSDGDEAAVGRNPNGDGMLDSDGDGLLDIDEIVYGTDRYDDDTDDDGYHDSLELRNGFNPLGSGLLPRNETGFTTGEYVVSAAKLILFRLRNLLPF